MFKKIDCVMIRVADVEAAAYYAEVFGMCPLCILDMTKGPRPLNLIEG